MIEIRAMRRTMETLIICPNQIADERARERERGRERGREAREKKETIVTADKSSCLHISIPSMYNITIKHQQ